jgi:hypothetical protein
MLKMVRDGTYKKKVLFDCELVGWIDQVSPGRYQVWSLKEHGQGQQSSYVLGSMGECVSLFTSVDWRSVVGVSALKTLPPTHYEPKRTKLTKDRWSIY